MNDAKRPPSLETKGLIDTAGEIVAAAGGAAVVSAAVTQAGRVLCTTITEHGKTERARLTGRCDEQAGNQNDEPRE